MARFDTQSHTPDDLLIGSEVPTRTVKKTIAQGQVLGRGAVLGEDSAGGDAGQLRLSVAAANDGTQAPKYVLAQAVDATAGATDALVYESAEVNARALVFGAGHTADSTRAALRTAGIVVTKTLRA